MSEQDLSPLPLPKYTFICSGEPTTRNALAEGLSLRDKDLCVCDFLEPLRMATHSLFFGGYHGTELPDKISSINFSVKEFLMHLESLIESIDDAALSHMALEEIRRDGEFFQRYIFRDAALVDISPFIKADGQESCLRVFPEDLPDHFNELPDSRNPALKLPARSIWLPEPSIEAKIARLSQELQK